MRKFTGQFSDFDILGLRAFFVYLVMLVKHFRICTLQRGKVSCIHYKLFINLIYIHYIIEEDRGGRLGYYLNVKFTNCM